MVKLAWQALARATRLPKQTLTVDFDADNPGLWVAHCHNIYHAETGMTTVIGYRA